MRRFSTITKKLNLVGAPFCLGQKRLGVEMGPSILRRNGITNILEKNGYIVNDTKDLILENQTPLQSASKVPDKEKALSKYNQLLSEKVAKLYSNDSLTLTIGGDHSIAMGSIAGVLKKNPNVGIIWVDAHADINTLDTSPSRNIHGMPVSYLMKISNVNDGFEWLNSVPTLSTKNIFYIGLRDVDEGEKKILREKNIKSIYWNEGEKKDAMKSVEEAFEALKHCDKLHLSFDIDSLDPPLTPSTGTPVKQGLTLKEAEQICSAIYKTGRMKSMDLVEINPSLGEGKKDVEQTVESGLNVINYATGGVTMD